MKSPKTAKTRILHNAALDAGYLVGIAEPTPHAIDPRYYEKIAEFIVDSVKKSRREKVAIETLDELAKFIDPRLKNDTLWYYLQKAPFVDVEIKLNLRINRAELKKWRENGKVKPAGA